MKPRRIELVTIYALSLAWIAVLVACTAINQPPVTPTPLPPGPPIHQVWTNALRLPDGGTTPGIAIYLPQPASVALTKLLADAGAQKRSATAWTIEKLDLNSQAHIDLLKAIGYAGGHTAQHVSQRREVHRP